MNIRAHHRQPLELIEPTPVQKALALVIKAQWWMIFAIALGFASYYYLRPLPGTEQMQSRVAKLETEKKALGAEKEKISRRIAWVQDENTEYLELMARDWLDWQKEGEMIIRIPKVKIQQDNQPKP